MMSHPVLSFRSSGFLQRSVSAAFLMAVLVSGGAGFVFAATNSGWQTTKVTKGGASGPYCAVSRQMDETVVTVGRTLSGQSSLALEMKGAKLDPKRVYRLSLKPGNADRIEIETKPLNTRTFVLNLDQVVDLPASFSASPTLQMRYDDVSMALSLANWKGAAKDMETCLAGLSGEPASPVVAAAEPHVEKGVAVTPRAPEEPVKKSNEFSALRTERDRLSDDLKRVKDELETLRSTRSADRAAQESDKKLREDLALRMSVLEGENQRLKEAAATVSSAKAEKEKHQAEQAKAAADLASATSEFEKQRKTYEQNIEQLKQDNTALTRQIESVKADKAVQVTQQSDLEQLKTQLAKAKADYAALDAQKNALSVKAEETVKVQGAAKDQGKKIVQLQKDLDIARAESVRLSAQVAELSEKQKGPDLADLQRRMEVVTAENVKLRADLASATVPETEMRVSVAAEAPLRQQLRDLKTKNESMSARVSELMKLLDNQQKGSEKTLIEASGKNWDLEQATRRLQESEREVQRLSLMLRDGSSKCEAEKREIEYMLFDPKLAKEGQIALLNSLEDQVAMLKAGKMPSETTAAIVPSESNVKNVEVVESETTARPDIKAEALAAPASMAVVANVSGPVGLTSLLKQAGIAVTRGVEPLAKNPFGTGQAWAWETETLAGLAVEQSAVKSKDFDGAVSARIKTLKSKCKGDFAATPSVSVSSAAGGGLVYAGYDAACISGANSTSAALLFFQKEGRFNVISHEAAPDSMADAMEARDRLLTTVAGK